jgi:hypothetical protein
MHRKLIAIPAIALTAGISLAACGTVSTSPATRPAAAAPARPWSISQGQGLQNALTAQPATGAPVFAGARLQSALTAGTVYATTTK